MRPRLLLFTVLVLVPMALPAGAAADDFQRIFGDYRSDGELNGCYSPSELHNAGREIPPDIEQYTPGFGDALAAAQARCSGPSAAPEEEEPEEAAALSTGTPGPGASDFTKQAVKDPPAPEVAAARTIANLPDPRLNVAGAAIATETPGALVALLVAAGLAFLVALAWTVVWFMGWSPERLTKPLFATFQTAWDRLIPGR